MWQHSYSKVFQGLKPENIYSIWTDINNWHLWNPGIEFCKLEQPFIEGSIFTLKPMGMKPVKIQLVEVIENAKFKDCTTFPGAKMYGMHEVHAEDGGVRLVTTMTITGPLGFLWRKLVGEKVAAKNAQTNRKLSRIGEKKCQLKVLLDLTSQRIALVFCFGKQPLRGNAKFAFS